MLLVLPAIAACDGRKAIDALAAQQAKGPVALPAVVELAETFMSALDTATNIDSPAVYHGAGGQHWVIATAKGIHQLVVFDAETGQQLMRVGAQGSAAGELNRPNGIVVVDDSLALVVERDNRRVQVFRLPSFAPLGSFGESVLQVPYGIAWMHDSASTYKVYVTDNYESPITTIPRERDLGQRVKVFAVRVEDGAVRAMHVRSFGDTTSAGAIRVTESLAVDSAYGRLLIAEELETDSHIKIYDLDGRFTGRVLGRGLFPQQAEGIALYACGAMGGYWIATDQGDNTNTFVVFDRATLEVVGRVTGRTTRRTDGIAVTEQGYGPFRKGALYAAHVDAGIGALSWEAIEATLRGGKAGCDA